MQLFCSTAIRLSAHEWVGESEFQSGYFSESRFLAGDWNCPLFKDYDPVQPYEHKKV